MYTLFLYVLINPYLFPYHGERDFGTIVLIVFFTSVLIPGISILLMYGTGFISSLHMKERTERIGPLIVTAIAYLWLYLNIRTHNAIPISFALFVLGALISIFFAFFINNFSKISLHGVGMGGFLSGVIYLLFKHGESYVSIKGVMMNNILFLSLLIILTGAVLSSRLYLKAHTNQDVIGGLIVGMAGQIIALRFF
ncbi:MAG: hypothetical protein KJO50_03110 [Bacteroidia bacterium]|nr:hypothetical protein [Bacteroidia bacterium]